MGKTITGADCCTLPGVLCNAVDVISMYVS
jgi:hypothetical protein